MNIFRPAYNSKTLRERGRGRYGRLGKQPSGKKVLDVAGERRLEEIEGIQLCPSLTQFHRRQMRTYYKSIGEL